MNFQERIYKMSAAAGSPANIRIYVAIAAPVVRYLVLPYVGTKDPNNNGMG